MSAENRVSIAEFRERHGLPEGTEYVLTEHGRNGWGVWVPADTRPPRGWSYDGFTGRTGYRKLRPHGNYREGKAAFEDLARADLPGAEKFYATATHDEEIADKVLAAAERMGPIEIIRADGTTAVFVPAPASSGVRLP